VEAGPCESCPSKSSRASADDAGKLQAYARELFSQNFSDRVFVVIGNSLKQPVKGGQNFVLEAMYVDPRTMRRRIRTLNVFDPA
jgi:hypothetical protein